MSRQEGSRAFRVTSECPFMELLMLSGQVYVRPLVSSSGPAPIDLCRIAQLGGYCQKPPPLVVIWLRTQTPSSFKVKPVACLRAERFDLICARNSSVQLTA